MHEGKQGCTRNLSLCPVFAETALETVNKRHPTPQNTLASVPITLLWALLKPPTLSGPGGRPA